jgi:hypothetical protein
MQEMHFKVKVESDDIRKLTTAKPIPALAELVWNARDAYFDGADEAVGIVLIKMCRGTPVAIERRRVVRNGFRPPQVIARITDARRNLFAFCRWRASRHLDLHQFWTFVRC